MVGKPFWISLMLCALAACGSNVSPGDEQYPVPNKNPQRPLDITLIQAPSVRAEFPVTFYAANWLGTHKDKCTYSGFGGGVPARVVYTVTVPLLFKARGDALHSNFAFDMFERGFCGYEFRSLEYRVDPNLALQLILYKDDPSLPNEVSVDLWCYPAMGSANDYSCDSMTAAAMQNTNATAASRRPWLPTKEQAATAKANGDKEPPALLGPNTHSLIIRVHDARIN